MWYARIKHFLFRYYGLVALLILIPTIMSFLKGPKGKDEITVFLTIIGSLASALYFIQKQKLEELHLFKELFVEFNARYDKLNEDLNRIVFAEPKGELTQEEKNLLNDYFNLCGEEFLFFRRGYIYPEVWRAWHNGMKFFIVKDDRVKDYWKRESKTDSYYGLRI